MLSLSSRNEGDGFDNQNLSIPLPIPDEEKKFIFTLPSGVSKGFMKAFEKPFRAPEGRVITVSSFTIIALQTKFDHITLKI